VRTAVRTIAPLKPENGGNGWLLAVVLVRVKSLVEGTIGNELSLPVSEGKCPGQNWGSRGRRFKSGQLLSAGLFDNALASLGEDGSAALSEDARRRRPVGMVTSDRRRGDARLFSCV
jgi:hypothetical protein